MCMALMPQDEKAEEKPSQIQAAAPAAKELQHLCHECIYIAVSEYIHIYISIYMYTHIFYIYVCTYTNISITYIEITHTMCIFLVCTSMQCINPNIPPTPKRTI